MIGITRPDGSTVRLRFEHRQGTMMKGESQFPLFYRHPERKREDKRGAVRAQTLCSIETGDKFDPEVLTQGLADCAMVDNFSKEEGRQRALAKALINVIDTITPDEAHQLLGAYFNRPRGKVARRMQEQNVARKATLSPSTETA